MAIIIDGKQSNFPFNTDSFDTYTNNISVIPSSGINDMMQAAYALEKELLGTPQPSGANMYLAAATITINSVSDGTTGSIVLPTNAATSALASYLTSGSLGPSGTVTLLIQARPEDTETVLRQICENEKTAAVVTSSVAVSSGWTSGSALATYTEDPIAGARFSVTSNITTGITIGKVDAALSLDDTYSHYQIFYGLEYSDDVNVVTKLKNAKAATNMEWFEIVVYDDVGLTNELDSIRIPIHDRMAYSVTGDSNTSRKWYKAQLVGPNSWYTARDVKGFGLKITSSRPKVLSSSGASITGAESITIREIKAISNAPWLTPIYEFTWWWVDRTTKEIGYKFTSSQPAAQVTANLPNFIISIIAIK